MPEISEVTITSQYLLSKLQNKKFTNIKIISGRYTHQELQSIDKIDDIISKKYIVKNIDTKGKLMWFELTKNNKTIYLTCNFGLTGVWSFEKEELNSIRIKFTFDDIKVYFSDARNFGIISFISKSELDIKLKKLAPDYLKSPYNLIDFSNKIKEISRKNKKIIEILMDQTLLGSGLGNYLSVEILYNARISPHRTLDTLTKKEINKLYNSIYKIVKISYSSNSSGYMKYLDEYIKTNHLNNIKNNPVLDFLSNIKTSSKFKFKVYQQEFDPKGNKVMQDKIIPNRTTYWVPDVQK
jgi:formamidopyrimidine-DNA glycosylase